MKTEAKDLLLPAVIVAVVAIMIFPMPSVILDTLLMCNISFALLLLISAVYIAEPQRFTALPSILLLSTLCRLGLNIATTRQILSTESIPEIILTFGDFVVNGNSVVGVVIFIIITVVQFLVIAKGSERVAEVAARFTLDAMPGKQMSIDADIRSGILSIQEARTRRRELQIEAKLFGALDGAMKFVKGDAIAGLLITLINISAGFVVGITQQGLSLVEAVQRFTMYTIGDGLVSQIPALLVAVAAGIIVTRVSDNESMFLGRDMLGQITREPQALTASSAVLLGLAWVPGLPALPFVGMALVFFVLSRGVREQRTADARAEQSPLFKPRAGAKIVLKLSVEAVRQVRLAGRFVEQITELRSRIFQTRGVIVPEIEFEIVSERAGCWVGIAIQDVLGRAFELEEPTPTDVVQDILRGVEEEIVRRLPELMDDTHTRMLLEVYQSTAEDLIHSLIPEVLRVTQVTCVLRALVQENVSIKELPLVLQAISELQFRGGPSRLGPSEHTVLKEDAMVQAIRFALRRSICASLTREPTIEIFTVIPLLEDELLECRERGSTIRPMLLAQVLEELQEVPPAAVIVIQPAIRSLFSTAVREERPDLVILAPDELVAELEVIVCGEIGRTMYPSEVNDLDEAA